MRLETFLIGQAKKRYLFFLSQALKTHDLMVITKKYMYKFFPLEWKSQSSLPLPTAKKLV